LTEPVTLAMIYQLQRRILEELRNLRKELTDEARAPKQRQ
jgi:hypothetical protein